MHTGDGRHGGARFATMALGAWLIASSFQWPHASAQRTNALAVGAISILAAALALRVEAFRWVNLALSAWLLASVWVLPHVSGATTWSNGITALAMLLVSLIPNRGPGTAMFERSPA